MRGDLYQYTLIGLGVVATVLFGVFLSRELFPEYKIYQNDYIELEQFRSTYRHEPPPQFATGVKQIVFEREDKGPPVIDRCTSCHVALQFPHFSPTKLAYDINGNIILDDEGRPVQVPNETYIWEKLDLAIAELTDPAINEGLKKKGEESKVKERLAQAERYRALKTAQVDDHVYDVTKVLRMHPLMGRETRPFEYHPVEEYGCTSCHNGNGRGLTTDKAHGPVFDGQYEVEFRGPVPKFTEEDPDNDPAFAREFNDKPSHELLFQTSPIFVGNLIQAKCMNCHQSSASILQGAADSAGVVADRRGKIYNALKVSLDNEKEALMVLVSLSVEIKGKGLDRVLEELRKKEQDFSLPRRQLDQAKAQLNFLLGAGSSDKQVLEALSAQIGGLLGSPALAQNLLAAAQSKETLPSVAVEKFLVEQRDSPLATGPVFKKAHYLELEKDILRHVQDTDTSFQKTVNDQQVVSAMASEIDFLTLNYHRGEQLYIAQACYACHRISGLARGGVGPELTRIGKSYPWYIKESVVWPQADLPTSTMPNYRMDHEDLEDLMTFLLGQTGERKAVSETTYKTMVQDWEAGKKLPWEKPITPKQIHDVRYAMTVFATEGCSACHRLKGFESNVGFSIEKEKGKDDWEKVYREREWFSKLVPETISGSELVQVLDTHAEEIDKRIVNNVRKDSIVEEIDKIVPGQVESLYTPFKYAARAKNHYYAELSKGEKDPKKKKEIADKLKEWKERVHRTLMMFIQEYGYGRLIGPRPNWSGVYRSDEWLMEHFRNPQSHIPHSIMPVMPFDDTKFYALTYMLDVLGKRNRNEVRAIWEHRGFNPELAFHIYCAQCHGPYLQGNGPVADWIYPIPKNLRNPDFLRNLTKERVNFSITHGVKGTPMPPWGEVWPNKPMADTVPVLTAEEIGLLTNWIFSSLPGSTVIKGAHDVPKWNYKPEDVLREIKEEGNELKSSPESDPKDSSEKGLVVQDYFDKIKNSRGSADEYSYFIKKKFYTDENIEQGKAFFELNCAVCHGADADGTGARASAMKDAKPRMLTNLDWGNNRDDLRLLRSIKYGVAGTAMNPWGDLTSSLQRMQLVIFIRSLTEEARMSERLAETLYLIYEHDGLTVENARIHEYATLAKVKESYNSLQEQRVHLYETFGTDTIPTNKALEIYDQELEALASLKKYQQIDQTLTNLKNQIAKEREVYQNLGKSLQKDGGEANFETFLALVSIGGGNFSFANDKLQVSFDPDREKERAALGEKIVADLDHRIEEANKQKIVVEGRIFSKERTELLKKLKLESDTYAKLKAQLINGLSEAARARQQQKQLYDEYQTMTKHNRLET